MRELSLFSGAGGGLLATKHLLGWTTMGYVEFDDYCQRVLRARIDDGLLDRAPIFTDVREFIESGAVDQYAGIVDVVSGGFPCQPFSQAGRGLAEQDERNMWPATVECIRRVRPRFAFLENVPGLLAKSYFGTVLGDLAASGYDARWDCLPASAIGANHPRDRLWIVAARGGLPDPGDIDRWQQQLTQRGEGARDVAAADSTSDGRLPERAGASVAEPGKCGQIVADANSRGFKVRSEHDSQKKEDTTDWCACRRHTDGRGGEGWWKAEPAVGRVVDGMAHRVGQLRALGNGQVPAVAALAWQVLSGNAR